MSISQRKIKQILSLKQKKHRQKYNIFVAEGQNIAQELDKHQGKLYNLKEAYYHRDESARYFDPAIATQVSQADLRKASLLKNPSDCIMLCEPIIQPLDDDLGDLVFYTDGLQDPGNMGSIIRIANWFGAKTVIRSPESADFYNPKVIQATMGGFLGVQLITATETDWICDNYEWIALDMAGESLYTATFQHKTICVIGREGSGVSDVIRRKAKRTISIPAANNDLAVDSLNAAVSAGIFAGIWQSKF